MSPVNCLRPVTGTVEHPINAMIVRKRTPPNKNPQTFVPMAESRPCRQPLDNPAIPAQHIGNSPNGAALGSPMKGILSRSPRVTQELSVFNDLRNLGWDHLFPFRVAFCYSGEDVAREDWQAILIVIGDCLDKMVLDQVSVKVLQI